MRTSLVLNLALALLSVSPLRAEELAISIDYIQQKIVRPSVLSNLVKWPEDDGIAGANLGLEDNNTTGKFLQHRYTVNQAEFDTSDETVRRAQEILARGARLVVLNVDADTLIKIADLPESRDDLLFNARSMADSLRNDECRDNVVHTMPSRAMLSDALMQFLSKRQWRSLFLIEGNRTGDQLYATSLRRSAKKFGLKIGEQKKWLDNSDIRRNASQEVPGFTQAKKYDVIVVTDEDQDFSQYLLYNTWLPRPIAGSAGLRPVAWSPVMEQWGALQLQSRFDDLVERPMTALDYANWAAVRSIGEAVTRTGSQDIAKLKKYLLSPEFSLAAFKGKKMSYRAWNGQLRQPIPLVHSRAVVAMAPIEGFLHRVTELDTLGVDQAESVCNVFSESN